MSDAISLATLGAYLVRECEQIRRLHLQAPTATARVRLDLIEIRLPFGADDAKSPVRAVSIGLDEELTADAALQNLTLLAQHLKVRVDAPRLKLRPPETVMPLTLRCKF